MLPVLLGVPLEKYESNQPQAVFRTLSKNNQLPDENSPVSEQDRVDGSAGEWGDVFLSHGP